MHLNESRNSLGRKNYSCYKITNILSGTQGVMMTHRNVLATASAVLTIVPGLGSKDVYLAYLPLAHILELAAEVMYQYLTKFVGCVVYSCLHFTFIKSEI